MPRKCRTPKTLLISDLKDYPTDIECAISIIEKKNSGKVDIFLKLAKPETVAY